MAKLGFELIGSTDRHAADWAMKPSYCFRKGYNGKKRGLFSVFQKLALDEYLLVKEYFGHGTFNVFLSCFQSTLSAGGGHKAIWYGFITDN